jgi:Spy/CpxP family protein refolding chaperone
MTCFRLFAVGILLALTVSVAAQQAGTARHEDPHSNAQKTAPTAEAQLKMFAEKFDLTADQQGKIKPILQNLHEFTAKVMEDKALTHEEKIAKLKPARMKAHEQMIALLTEDQKKKVEEYMKGPHPEMHGDPSGAEESGR